MIRAKKSLGQNFLISPRVVEAIAAAGNLRPNDLVIEIGPGKGVLTAALLKAGARVRAVEKDDRLIPLLETAFANETTTGKLEIIHGDILEEGKDGDADAPFSTPDESYKVIANIPYYITGQIIRSFLSADRKPSLMVLMVQKEVASRVIARDGKESLLSISVKAYAKPELIMNVSRGNFFPIPNVDSAVIRLSDISTPFKSSDEERRFFALARAGFGQKRKRLAKNLEAVAEKSAVEGAFAKLGIDPNRRAEDMSLGDWIELARLLAKS